MKRTRIYAAVLASAVLFPSFISARQNPETPVKHRLYLSNGLDAAIFSTSVLQRGAAAEKLTTLRFTYAFNFGTNLNFDFNRYFGIMSGIGIKNIGFINKSGDTTFKRRTYTAGIPLGIKIGDLRNRNFVFLGGGVDVPFNFKEKWFLTRNRKSKFNEWFSDRTPAFLPYVFAGVSVNPGLTLKLQYYPNNFLNQDFLESANPKSSNVIHNTAPGTGFLQPYKDYKRTSLLMLSVGIDLHYKKYGAVSRTSDDGLRQM